MRRERLQNDSSTTLNGNIDDTQTTITVTNGAAFPSEGDFRLLIESEILLCTARSSNSLTVVRGREGTANVSHLDTTAVNLILTEDAVEEYVRQNTNPFHNYSPALRIFNNSGAIIGESSFTWLNQGGATATDINNSILLKGVNDTTANVRGKHIASPTAPYTVVAAVQMFHNTVANASGQPRGGIFFRESSTGELIWLVTRHVADQPGITFNVLKFNSATSFNVEAAAAVYTNPGGLIWLKLEDNATNLIFSVSLDGVNWRQIFSEGRTAFMAGGPDQIGFAIQSNTASVTPWMYLHHFRAE